MLTVQTWMRRPRLRSRRPSLGWSRSRSIPGPAIHPGPSMLTAICQETWRSMRSTTSSSGAHRFTRFSATGEKLITRAGESVPDQPIEASSSTSRRSTSPA